MIFSSLPFPPEVSGLLRQFKSYLRPSTKELASKSTSKVLIKG